MFYALYESNFQRVDHSFPFQCKTGILLVGTSQLDQDRLRCHTFEVMQEELDLINRIVDIVQELDPDIIVGWDVQTASWGYLNARANTYGNIPRQLSI